MGSRTRFGRRVRADSAASTLTAVLHALAPGARPPLGFNGAWLAMLPKPLRIGPVRKWPQAHGALGAQCRIPLRTWPQAWAADLSAKGHERPSALLAAAFL